MKKILGIIGSPRKNGNTHVLVSRILEGAESKGFLPETVFLNDLRIQECNGCHACWKTGSCAKKDDMSNLYQKIIESDVIVFGTPVYWYGPTALMKAFIDRFIFFNGPTNRIKIKNKLAIIAIPFEEEDMKTVAPVIAFFERSLNYLEMNLVGKLIVPGVTLKGEVKDKVEYMEKAYQLGIALEESVSSV
jgi:multimeric flavodoxin WrbA